MKIQNLLGLLLILNVNLLADKTVTKTSFVNMDNYKNKSMEEIKSILLDKVKIDAASEIFGDFIKQETDIENGKMIRNSIISEKNGLVHLKGEPKYAMGNNFGDIQVTVVAFATDEDLANMSVQTINVDKFVYTNKKIPLNKIEKAAEDAFLVYALSTKDTSIKSNANRVSIARKLATSVKIDKKFDVNNASYTMSGSVGYVPFFLKQRLK